MSNIIQNLDEDLFLYDENVLCEFEPYDEHKEIRKHVLEESGFTIYPYKLLIDKVIFNKPATIVLWTDGTKTVVKCQKGDKYSKETGLALAISKKALGNKAFHKTFNKFVGEDDE